MNVINLIGTFGNCQRSVTLGRSAIIHTVEGAHERLSELRVVYVKVFTGPCRPIGCPPTCIHTSSQAFSVFCTGASLSMITASSGATERGALRRTQGCVNWLPFSRRPPQDLGTWQSIRADGICNSL